MRSESDDQPKCEADSSHTRRSMEVWAFTKYVGGRSIVDFIVVRLYHHPSMPRRHRQYSPSQPSTSVKGGGITRRGITRRGRWAGGEDAIRYHPRRSGAEVGGAIGGADPIDTLRQNIHGRPSRREGRSRCLFTWAVKRYHL